MSKFNKYYILFAIFNTTFVFIFVSGDDAESRPDSDQLMMEPLQENLPPEELLDLAYTSTPLYIPEYDLRNYTVAEFAPFGYHREYNIILYGIPPGEINKHGSLFAYVFYLLNEVCGVEMEPPDILAMRYMRKRNAPMHRLGQIWPVLVTLRTMALKAKLIHRRRLLAISKIKLEHELPSEIYEAQNKLLKPLMKKHRDLGAYAVVRNGKLIVNGLIVTQIPVPKQFTYDSQSEERYNAIVYKKLRESGRVTAAHGNGFSPRNSDTTSDHQDQPEANMEEIP